MNLSMKKIKKVRHALNNKFLERENEIEGILLSLLAQQHILLIGSAGTAKSALSSEITEVFEGAQYFQWLLTSFSTPEEVFGPLSLKDLEQGLYKRNTTFKMPEAHIVFLDEIFKANSAILNSMLTLINERIFSNDSVPTEVPLMTVIGASNEFPEDEEGLEALFDRFLLRYEVTAIKEESNFLSMMKDKTKNIDIPRLHLSELMELQGRTKKIAVQDEIFDTLAEIRNELQCEGINPSDRRFKQSLSILQAKALLEEKDCVQSNHLYILENILWENPSQKKTVCSIVRRHAGGSQGVSFAGIEKEAEEIYDNAIRDQSMDAGLEAIKKLRMLQNDLYQLKEGHSNQSRLQGIKELLDKLSYMRREVENSRLDPYDYGNERVR